MLKHSVGPLPSAVQNNGLHAKSFLNVRMYVCMYVCMNVCLYVWLYLCMYVCMYVWMNVCMYVYIRCLYQKNLLSPFKLYLWRPVSYTLCQKRPTNKVFSLTYLSAEIFPHPSNPSLFLIWSFLQCSSSFPSLLWSFLQYPFFSDGFRRFFLSYLEYLVRHCCNTWSCAFLIHNKYLWMKRNSKFENTLRNSNCNSNVQTFEISENLWMLDETPYQTSLVIYWYYNKQCQKSTHAANNCKIEKNDVNYLRPGET